MACSDSTDILNLNKLQYFKLITNYNSDDRMKEIKSLLQYCNSRLFAWCAAEHCVSCLQTKDIIVPSGGDEFQWLQPTEPILMDVSSILVNASVNKIAIVGENAIFVMTLNRELEKGTKDITCRTVMIEAFPKEVVVRRVLWHPGARDDHLLMVLTGDNILKLYDTKTCEVIERWVLRKELKKRLPLHSRSEETAVDFAFVPQIKYDRPELLPLYIKSPHDVWIVLLLTGTGDVYILYTFLSKNGYPLKDPSRFQHNRLQGPLVMCPAAEDNYGVDSTSILVINGPPPIVAIASSTGVVYNCLLLPFSNDESETTLMNASALSRLSAPTVSEYGLFGFESLELDLGGVTLSAPIDENSDTDLSSFPVVLVPDQTNSMRYFVAHSAGVHSVTIPVAHDLSFCITEGTTPESERLRRLDFIKSQSEVEYILCTRLSPSRSLVQVPFGIVCADLPTATLITLLANSATSIEIKARNTSKSLTSALKETRQDEISAFEQQVVDSVRRTASPFFKIQDSPLGLSPQACFELVCQATTFFREEVFPRHYRCLQILESRSQILRKMKEHQLENLRVYLDSKKELQDKAEQLAEKYEEIFENQSQIAKRAEKCLITVKTMDIGLTHAENKMLSHLKKHQETLKRIKEQLVTLRNKHETVKTTVTSCLDNIQTPMRSLLPTIASPQNAFVKNHISRVDGDLKRMVNLVRDTERQLKSNICLEPQNEDESNINLLY